jgi:uncharacterized protein (UPF0333 family)
MTARDHSQESFRSIRSSAAAKNLTCVFLIYHGAIQVNMKTCFNSGKQPQNYTKPLKMFTEMKLCPIHAFKWFKRLQEWG